ncbi:hypothetical protein BDV12DRAFT_187590 [Aspergillus spectabilis]
MFQSKAEHNTEDLLGQNILCWIVTNDVAFILKNELSQTCSTITLSLDVCTSKNHKSILGVYQECVLDFSKLVGSHSGENMAEMLYNIIADNVSNNDTLMSELYFNLTENQNSERAGSLTKGHLRFQDVDSYICCLAHVLNRIMSDVLSALKSGGHAVTMKACALLQENKEIRQYSALARLRNMVLWIFRTPQQQQ